MALSIDTLKNVLYCNIQDNTFDDQLQDVLDGVINDFIVELDSEDFTASTDFDGYADLERAAYKQATYAWKRRNDLGLSSTSFPDGTINRFNDDLFLKEVQDVLDKYRSHTI